MRQILRRIAGWYLIRAQEADRSDEVGVMFDWKNPDQVSQLMVNWDIVQQIRERQRTN